MYLSSTSNIVPFRGPIICPKDAIFTDKSESLLHLDEYIVHTLWYYEFYNTQVPSSDVITSLWVTSS